MAGKPKIMWTDEQIKQIEQMALDNCHVETIARTLGTTDETIKAHFSPLIKQKRAEGRALLRRSQRDKAVISKDTGMLCFLGKNELEQTDKQEHKHGITKELGSLLGLIDGSTKGRLPNKEEAKNAGQ